MSRASSASDLSAVTTSTVYAPPQVCVQRVAHPHSQDWILLPIMAVYFLPIPSPMPPQLPFSHSQRVTGPVMLAPFGTKGDVLPMLFAAVGVVAAEAADVLFVTQPRMRTAVLSSMRDARDFHCVLSRNFCVPAQCNEYTFVPESAQVRRHPGATRQVLLDVEQHVFERSEGGRLTCLWASPMQGSCNEIDYQSPFMVDSPSWRCLDSYGEFLGNWQALLSFVVASMAPSEVKFVTSHYASLEMVSTIEAALGITSSAIMRVGSMGLRDPCENRGSHNMCYAMSPKLAPEKLQCMGQLVCPDPRMKEQCLGAIVQSPSLFRQELPERVTSFFRRRKPTVVVVISSFGQVTEVARLFRSSQRYQVLFLDSDGCDHDGHMHFDGMVNLTAAFREADLIVHGCGVGTICQVALSGKPSVGVSGLCEQASNGERLQELKISKHFELKSLCGSSADRIEEFRACLDSFFDDPRSIGIDPEAVKQVQEAVKLESERAFTNFRERMHELLALPRAT